ncbi:MAG: MFS transporter [Pseudomonadota bacterium]
MIAFTTNPWIIFPNLILLSIGFSYILPLIAASVKLFSTKKIQKFAFSWYYVFMNIGALIAGFTVNHIKIHIKTNILIPILGFEFSVRPVQIIFFIPLILAGIIIFLIFRYMNSEQLENKNHIHSTVPEKDVFTKKEKSIPLKIMKDIGSDKLFWVFMLFLFLLVLVEMVFEYSHSVYPVYVERIGLAEWIEKLYIINPIIIILVPVITALTGRLRGYTVITIGAFVVAGSVFFLGISESVLMIIIYQIFLSIGEAIFYPRIYDYTASVAPEGHLVSYMALSKIPLFFGRTMTGPLTGILLFSLCPETGERNTMLMWFIIGFSALITPITLLIWRRKLDVESLRRAEKFKGLGK